MPLIQTGTIGRSTTPSLAARKWTGTVIEWSTWNSSLRVEVERRGDARRVEVPRERLVDRDVVEAGLARPVVGSGPVGADGHADGERGQPVVEPVVEVIGVEHDQHVGIDVVDMAAHRPRTRGPRATPGWPRSRPATSACAAPRTRRRSSPWSSERLRSGPGDATRGRRSRGSRSACSMRLDTVHLHSLSLLTP